MQADAIFDIDPLPATFGATVSGLKLARLDDDEFKALYRTWLDYGLLIFPAQHLTRDEQVAFAHRFGPIEIEITPISNVRPDGTLRRDDGDDDVVKVLKGNMGWHCDSTYMPVQAKGAVFTAHVTPSQAGETGFADMAAAYDALDDSTKARVAELSAFHSLNYSQGKLGHVQKAGSSYSGYGMTVAQPPLRPLVKEHPETGRRCLMIGRHAYGVPGLDPTESERFLENLTTDACQVPRIWHHAWTPGDAVVWDNRRLMHRACPWNMQEPRVMYHSRLAGDPVSEFAGPG